MQPIPSWLSIREDGKKIVKEGTTEIVFDDQVFYNPVQEFNRDMSIAAINAFHDKKSLRILEALSATGLRSIRYAKEIPNVQIIANDLDETAVASIHRNIQHNQVENSVVSNQGDACHVMYRSLYEGESFDVIDLDPYGSAAPFLDGAIQSVKNGGLLCVTCTDTAVLAGGRPEACWTKYGGSNIPGAGYTHEMGLRILLHSIQTTAARYKRAIEPLLSCSIDFYMRVFVRIIDSPEQARSAASKTGLVYHCSGCKSFEIQPLGKVTNNDKSVKFSIPAVASNARCPHCNYVYHLGGPCYIDQLHSKEFVAKMLEIVDKQSFGTATRMKGMLTVIQEELVNPLFYVLPHLCHVLHCQSPPLKLFLSAILNAGYQVSSSHAAPQSIKTNAPSFFIWDVMRAWIKLQPIKPPSETSPAYKLTLNEPSTEISFEKHADCEPPSRKCKLVRYQLNPTANWGPKARPSKKQKSE